MSWALKLKPSILLFHKKLLHDHFIAKALLNCSKRLNY